MFARNRFLFNCDAPCVSSSLYTPLTFVNVDGFTGCFIGFLVYCVSHRSFDVSALETDDSRMNTHLIYFIAQG